MKFVRLKVGGFRPKIETNKQQNLIRANYEYLRLEFLVYCEPIVPRNDQSAEEWLADNCLNWEDDCQTGFNLCKEQAFNDLEDDIRFLCVPASGATFTILNTASSATNAAVPGLSFVIAGTGAIISGAICFDAQIDQFNEVDCPLCQEQWVEQCCD